jgi:hypothetical protein
MARFGSQYGTSLKSDTSQRFILLGDKLASLSWHSNFREALWIAVSILSRGPV